MDEESGMSWIHIDYDTTKWIWVPHHWQGLPWPDARTWADEVALAWWTLADVELVHEDQVSLFAAALRDYAVKAPSLFPGQSVYLYAPDPRRVPIPLAVMNLASTGDRSESLRELVREGDGEAVELPVVDLMKSPYLGNGLRSMRYFTVPEDGTLACSLNYAWRYEPQGTDVLLRAITTDVGRMSAFMDDFDEIALTARVLGDGQQS
jgi:hypothetical protein